MKRRRRGGLIPRTWRKNKPLRYTNVEDEPDLLLTDEPDGGAAAIPPPPPPLTCWESIAMRIKMRFGSKAAKRRQVQIALYTCSLAVATLKDKLQGLKQSQAQAEAEMMRMMAANDPPGAIEALRAKKRFARQAHNVERHMMQVQSHQMALQESETNLEVFKTMQRVGKSLKSFALTERLHFPDVDKNADVMQDALDNLREVNMALEPLDGDAEEDQAALWEELLAESGGHGSATAATAAVLPRLPVAPTTVVVPPPPPAAEVVAAAAAAKEPEEHQVAIL